MNFILKMAWRDSRASRRRLVMASLSIVLGVAALVAIGSFNANLRSAIDDQAKTLLGADLRVQGRVAFTPEVATALDELSGEQASEVALSTMIVFPQADNATRLATLRALEGNYPFYGVFETIPATAPQQLAQGGRVAILEETLMAQFGVKVGQEIKLGTQFFEVVGALRQIPGDSAAVAICHHGCLFRAVSWRIRSFSGQGVWPGTAVTSSSMTGVILCRWRRNSASDFLGRI